MPHLCFQFSHEHPGIPAVHASSLTSLLFSYSSAQCLLHPQDELGQGVEGKLGSRRTGAQKGNLVLFSGLLTARSPIASQLNAELHGKHSTAWMLSYPGLCSFLKHILSPRFFSTFLLGRSPSLPLSLGTNLPWL